MSHSFGCKCSERKKPVQDRAWVVIDRECNYSAFNGYRYTPSAYSKVYCPVCESMGQTKASYVRHLKDAGKEWWKKPSDKEGDPKQE